MTSFFTGYDVIDDAALASDPEREREREVCICKGFTREAHQMVTHRLNVWLKV